MVKDIDEHIIPVAAGLNRDLPSFVEKLLNEQKYGKLRLMLQELRDVDRRLAVNMKIPVEHLQKRIQDRFHATLLTYFLFPKLHRLGVT